MSFFSNKNKNPELTADEVLNALRTVIDPDLKRDLVSLNMVRDVKVEEGRVSFTVVLTTPACPLKEHIRQECLRAVNALSGVRDVQINITSQVSTQAGAGTKQQIPGVRNIVAVSSGKGGVGKSTVATNLAICLAQTEAKVGLMDADAYGPNIPQMVGVNEAPTAAGNLIYPPEKYGVKVMSVALLTEPDQPVIWRGPMLHNLISQFLYNVAWGELDYLVVDMPPGTGDAQLSLTQHVPLAGAVMVTTPQQIAQADVRRAIMMFRRVEVPVLGIVENMAYFLCPDNNKRYDIFGTGGGERLAEQFQVPFLGRIPIDPRVVEGGDMGNPIVLSTPESEAAISFQAVAAAVAQQVSIANAQNRPLPVLQ